MPFSVKELVRRNLPFLAGLRPVSADDIKAGARVLMYSLRAEDGVGFGSWSELHLYNPPVVHAGLLGFGPRLVECCMQKGGIHPSDEHEFISLDEMLSDVCAPKEGCWWMNIYLVKDEARKGSYER